MNSNGLSAFIKRIPAKSMSPGARITIFDCGSRNIVELSLISPYLTMKNNKICPDCEIEYMPHIAKCADCGAELLSHEEFSQLQEEKKRLAAKAIENAAVVREGDLKWLGVLYNVLINAGIPCTVISDAACNKGRCGNTCRLLVSDEDFERARDRIAEYYREIDPELRASHELISQGKCPACGSPVGASDHECYDCGLTLMIIEKEEQEEDGREKA